jgi:hypothetical protein
LLYYNDNEHTFIQNHCLKVLQKYSISNALTQMKLIIICLIKTWSLYRFSED